MELNPVERAARLAWKPKDRRPAWKWAEDHVVVDSSSPMPGRWKSSNSPWVRDFMEVFADNHVRDLTVKCSAQSSKTQTVLNLLLWAIAEDPAPAMWVTSNEDMADSFVRNRLRPSITLCKPVANTLIQDQLSEFNFVGMSLYVVGAASRSKLQSTPIRWLILDEVRNYPKGALPTVLKRTRAFWNTRRVIISTPGNADDEIDRAWKAGDMRSPHLTCPSCQATTRLRFDNLRWDDSLKDEHGIYDFDAIAPTIHLRCPSCEHRWHDTPRERRDIAERVRFVRLNPSAPRDRVSFEWSALLPPMVTWRSIVEEFVEAKAALKVGDVEPMRTFITETLGESWEDRLGEIADFDGMEQCRADYAFGDPWAEETDRFMSVDKQAKGGEHYWWVIRAFAPFGKSRLISYGRANSTAELEQIRESYAVSPNNCMIDSGFKASEVYRFCAAKGWKAMKGDDVDHFIYRDKLKKRTIRRLYDRTSADPNLGVKTKAGKVGRSVPLFRWSNPSTKDLLAEFTSGMVGEWTIPNRIGRDYLRQMSAEHRRLVTDPRGRQKFSWVRVRADNHLFDCELQILVAAVAKGIIKAKPDGEAKAGED